jgi:signal transduction histidine kinase
MCWFIYIRFGKPLKQIETGMQRMKRGEANVQIHLNGAKEFRDIRDTFNMLSYSIQISKQRKQEEEYRKDKMLLDLSHDIRTPIATINNCAQALQEGIVQDEDQEKYYHIIQQKAKRVSNLTEDLFTLIKMKDADYKLSLENKDICEFLREICIEYYVEAEEAGITISANIPEEMCIYAADYDLLSRAIGNLLTNAIKYNRKGHQIFVELEQVDGNKIYIRVCDDGEPVDKDLVPHLFDDFSRGDQTRRTTGGTGLGLSITKAIIEKHGGSIVYRCEGDYNCFEVRIN